MKKLLNILVITCASLTLSAQDIHFSQYYAFPMTLNPALTGKFNGHYRVTGIYRDQYFNGPQPSGKLFMTPGGAIDLSLFKEKLRKHAFGLGFAFVNDQQNDKMFNDLRFYGSAGFTFGLGAKAKSQLSIGVQGVYNQLGFDANKAGLLDHVDVKEVYQNTQVRSFDLNTGLFFNTKFSDRTTFYIGGAVSNLLGHRVVFTSTNNSVKDSKMPVRYTGHTGFEIDAGKTKRWIIIPGLLYQNQANTMEENFGVTVGYHFVNEEDNKVTMFLGCWNRWNALNFESVIPKIGFEFKKIRISGAYDINLGGLGTDTKTAKYGNPLSSFEIAISFIGMFQPGIKEEIYLFNPRY